MGTNAVSGTNRPVHERQMNEAELMRERKAAPGVDLNEVPQGFSSKPGEAAEPEPVVMRDPVLGRALDLIKGISLLSRAQAP